MGNKNSAGRSVIAGSVDATSSNFEVEVSDDALHTMWDTFDVDRSGVLEEGEAIEFITAFFDAMRDQALAHARKADKKELKRTYKVLKANVRKIYAKVLDANGDGVISFGEMKAFIRGHTLYAVRDLVHDLVTDTLQTRSEMPVREGPFEANFVSNNIVSFGITAYKAKGRLVLNEEHGERTIGMLTRFEAAGSEEALSSISGIENGLVNGENYFTIVTECTADEGEEGRVTVALSCLPMDGEQDRLQVHTMEWSFGSTAGGPPVAITQSFDMGQIGAKTRAWEHAEPVAVDADDGALHEVMLAHIATIAAAITEGKRGELEEIFHHVPMEDDDRDSMLTELLACEVVDMEAAGYDVTDSDAFRPRLQCGGRVWAWVHATLPLSPLRLLSQGRKRNFPVYLCCVDGTWVQAVPMNI